MLTTISIQQHNIEASKSYFEEALEIANEIALKAPAVSIELFEIGSLFVEQLNNVDVDVLIFRLKEDLKFKAELVERNPRLYIPELARVMNNLGVLMVRRSEIAQAKANFEAAIDIYRDLVAEDPAYYLPYVAVIFNNLGEYISAWGLKVVDFSKIDYLCNYLTEIENTPNFSSPT
ncbi:MAG: hypothetical protein IPL49_05885 [Saprospirales bacterium]|nr:hypothetical protein [Saprospirales bacterium]